MFPIFSPSKVLDSIILMNLVKEGPLHGYALTSLIEEKMGWKPSQTAVYNSLKDMENKELVTVEERIEKGRAQKIYSITEHGRQFFEKASQKLKERMLKNFKRFFSLAQMVGGIEYREDSELFEKNIQPCLQNLEEIFVIILVLLGRVPDEAHTFIKSSLKSLREIATKHGIDIQGEMTDG